MLAVGVNDLRIPHWHRSTTVAQALLSASAFGGNANSRYAGAGFTLYRTIWISARANLLGDDSQAMREVGVELYQEMLRHAVDDANLGDETMPAMNHGLHGRRKSISG